MLNSAKREDSRLPNWLDTVLKFEYIEWALISWDRLGDSTHEESGLYAWEKLEREA